MHTIRFLRQQQTFFLPPFQILTVFPHFLWICFLILIHNKNSQPLQQGHNLITSQQGYKTVTHHSPWDNKNFWTTYGLFYFNGPTLSTGNVFSCAFKIVSANLPLSSAARKSLLGDTCLSGGVSSTVTSSPAETNHPTGTNKYKWLLTKALVFFPV
jgi:hypothetical protein